jgi:deazaflavin-dependent oxidoreductase (nitroreductase family)
MDSPPKKQIEIMSYPSSPFMKRLLKLPILFYRLGLGWLVGRIFMIITTIGRKSVQPRRTPIEFHEFKGRRYVFSGWGTKTDWYRNLEAHPHITIQTWRGAESVFAHRLTSDAELAASFEFAVSNPSMHMIMKSADVSQTLEQFLDQKERFTFVTFDPTDQPTPKPLKADLWWVWAVMACLALILVLNFRLLLK